MKAQYPKTDYETYREIMSELLRPISASGLDDDTLRRLYESKLVYLEKLRAKCFWEMNTSIDTHFTHEDHALILEAALLTKTHLREIVLLTITNKIAKAKRFASGF